MTRTIAILASALALAGCQTVHIAGCEAFRPITFSAAQDSPDTIRQVREHNAAWQAACAK